MSVQIAYDGWSQTYDAMPNKTRDLEAKSVKNLLENRQFDSILEMGCGTGKNTEGLLNISKHILAVDLSAEMLSKAKAKINTDSVVFKQANMIEQWAFAENKLFDLITFSLVLEHIENLSPIFEKAAKVLNSNGFVYVGELHPFKQYNGTKARFDTESGTEIVECYNHHISDFTSAALQNGFKIVALKEFFDDEKNLGLPRILGLLFQKN